MRVTTFLAQQQVEFSVSQFVPLALGFFGLGTGYLIYGPEELFKFPGRNRGVDLTTGIWGILMPGFLQFVTGVLLFVGLVWLDTFREPALFMAALAFTACGVHWWSLGSHVLSAAIPGRTGRRRATREQRSSHSAPVRASRATAPANDQTSKSIRSPCV